MSYKIITDSCADFENKIIDRDIFEKVPLTLSLGDVVIIDDDSFDQASFLSLMRNSAECPKSACPPVAAFVEAYDCGADDIYVVTLAESVSGSYNSALRAADIFKEEHPEKNVHVFNSRSAAGGETLIALKLNELAKTGAPFDEVVEKAERYTSELTTLFVLETLDVFRKNGRLSHLEATLAATMNIKPIMGASVEGKIEKVSQSIGINRALAKMVDIIAKRAKNPQERVLAVTHCNCIERAMRVKDSILARCPFKDAFIAEAGGISTMYANDGGIVVAF